MYVMIIVNLHVIFIVADVLQHVLVHVIMAVVMDVKVNVQIIVQMAVAHSAKEHVCLVQELNYKKIKGIGKNTYPLFLFISHLS